MGKQLAATGGFQSKFAQFNKNYFIFYILIGTGVVFSILSPDFLSYANMMTILKQTSIIAVVATGQFFVLVGGDFDLSVGSTVSLSGIIFGGAMVIFGMDPILAGLLALLCGITIGLINGVLVTIVGLPAFIGTMATMMSCSGISYILTKAAPIVNLPQSIGWIGRGAIGDIRTFGIPVLTVIMIIAFIVVYFVSEKTNFGRYIFAMGGNSEAAYLSGISTKKYKISTFVLSSGIAAIASIMLVSRLAAADPNAGSGYEFESITAAVIGGTAITGGKGRVIGVLLGSIFLAMLFNGMTLVNVNTFVQQVTKGIVLAAAVGIDVNKNRKAS